MVGNAVWEKSLQGGGGVCVCSGPAAFSRGGEREAGSHVGVAVVGQGQRLLGRGGRLGGLEGFTAETGEEDGGGVTRHKREI